MGDRENGEVVSQYRFPSDVQRQLLEAIGDRRICGELESRCLVTSTMPEMQSAGEIRADLDKVRSAVRNLIEANQSTSWESGFLLRMEGEKSKDDDIRKLNLKVLPSEDKDPLEQMLEQIEAFEKLLQATSESLNVRRGRKPRSLPLFQALNVLEIFHENDLHATSYQDGQYFRVLELVFSALFPRIGEEAYRRYGENALKQWPRYSQSKTPKA